MRDVGRIFLLFFALALLFVVHLPASADIPIIRTTRARAAIDIPSSTNTSYIAIIDEGGDTFTWIHFRGDVGPFQSPPIFFPGFDSGHTYGMDLESFGHEDYGWDHTFNPDFPIILAARLEVGAFDIDFNDPDGERDVVYTDGQDAGLLIGGNDQFSVTSFNIDQALLQDGLLDVFVDIDATHSVIWWSANIDYSRLVVVYRVGIPENSPPFQPVVNVLPDAPEVDDSLIASVNGPFPVDPDGDTVIYHFDWTVDRGFGFLPTGLAGMTDRTTIPGVPADSTTYDEIWRLRVRAFDGEFFSAVGEDRVTIAGNQQPTADAGPDQLVNADNVGDTVLVTLNGANSRDVDGAIVSHTWERSLSGGTFELLGAAAVITVPLVTGNHNIRLTVEDDASAIGRDFAVIRVNVRPRAALASTSGTEGTPVILNASASVDPDGQITRYDWDINGDGTFDSTTTVSVLTTTYADDFSGTLRLRVTDNDGVTAETTASVTIANVAPMPDAGPDRVVDEDTPVQLTGAYIDPGADLVTLTWNFGDGSPEVSGVTAAHTWPQPGLYALTLTARDDDGGVGVDTALITVRDRTAPVLTITSPTPGQVLRVPVTVEATAVDNADPNPALTYAPSRTFSMSGFHTVTVTAADASGNSSSRSVSFVLDLAAPSITITDPLDGSATNRASVEVVAAITDDLDTATVVTYQPQRIFTAEGVHTATVSAADFAGNAAQASSTFTIDRTPPALVIIAPPGGTSTRDSVIVVTQTSDNLDASIDVTLAPAPDAGNAYNIEGRHTVTAAARDDAGNTATVEVNFTIDRTAPAVTITSPLNNLLTKDPVRVEATVSDALDANPTVEFLPARDFNGTGDYTAAVRATDAAGNVANRSVTFRIDQTPPVITITNPPQNLITNQNVTLQYTATDNIETPPTATPANGVVFSATNRYAVPVTATDAVGNKATETAVFTIDKVPPIIRILSPENNSTTKETSVVVFTTDNFDTDVTIVVTPEGPYLDGAHTVTAVAVDDAGNTAAAIVTFTVDTVRPIVTILSPEDGLITTASSVTLTYDATDDRDTNLDVNVPNNTVFASETVALVTVRAIDDGGNVGEASVRFIIDRTPPEITILAPINGSLTNERFVTFTVIDNLDPAPESTVTPAGPYGAGRHTVTVTATDHAGLIDSKTVTFDIDLAPPTIEILEPTDGLLTNQDVPIRVTVNDDVTPPEEIIVSFSPPPDDGDRNAYTRTGVYTVTATAIDFAGNRTSDTVFFTIDKEAPAVTILDPLSGAKRTSDVDTVIVTATDNFDNDLPVTIKPLPPFVGSGAYSVTASAVDDAGNATTAMSNFIIDRIPPAITITNPPNGAFRRTNVTLQYSLADNFDPAPLGTPPSGTLFTTDTVQTFSITVNAQDDLGNASSASVNFTIDKVKPEASIEIARLIETAGDHPLTVSANEPLAAAPIVILRPSAEEFGGGPVLANLSNPSGDAVTWTGTIRIDQTTGDGFATFAASLTDRAGNVGTKLTGNELNIDVVKKPDLTTNSFEIRLGSTNVSVGKPVDVLVTVENRGETAASGFTIQYLDNNREFRRATFGALAVGERRTERVEWIPPRQGPRIITARILPPSEGELRTDNNVGNVVALVDASERSYDGLIVIKGRSPIYIPQTVTSGETVLVHGTCYYNPDFFDGESIQLRGGLVTVDFGGQIFRGFTNDSGFIDMIMVAPYVADTTIYNPHFRVTDGTFNQDREGLAEDNITVGPVDIDLAISELDILVIGGLAIDRPLVNQDPKSQIRIQIRNVGINPTNAADSDFRVGIYDDGQLVDSFNVPNIPANTTLTRFRPYSFPTVKVHKLRVQLDMDNEVAEAREDNNIAQKDIRVLSGQPDLVPVDVIHELNPFGLVLTETQVIIGARVKNLGGPDAPVTNLGLEALLVDTTGALVRIFGIDTPCPGIAGNEGETTVYFIIPRFDTPGQWRIRITADSGNLLPEDFEGNNVYLEGLTVFSGGGGGSVPPDLFAADMTFRPERVVDKTMFGESNPLAIDVTYANNLAGVSGPVEILFTLSSADTSFTRFATIADSFPSGASMSHTFIWDTPVAGLHTCTTFIDYPDSYGELNEDNNVLVREIYVFPEPLADLIARSVDILARPRIILTPANPDPGETVQVAFIVENDGDTWSEPFRVSFYFQNKSNLIGRMNFDTRIPGLTSSGGGSNIDTGHFTIPASFIDTTAVRVLLMELDDLNVVKEYREDNNEATKGFLIGAAIELIVLDTNLVVENVRPVVGETISISAVIFNAGIISTNNVLVYFYLDTTIPGALMDSTTISIAAGGSETAVGDIPTYALASGYHTIFVVVDPKNVFPEKNENNNQADAQFIIDTGAPVIRCDSIVTDTITPGAFSPNGDGINDSALIVYTVSDSIPGDIFVRIRILDRFGSVIRTIANPVLRPQGQNTVDTWDGLDRFGTAAPDDIYTVELRATDQTGNVSAVDTRCTVVVDAQPLRIDIPTAVPGNINPRDFVLSGPETTTISFEISEPANVSVFIVDSVSGDTVDTPILDQPAPRGLFAVRYTGTNMVLGNSHRVVVQARTPFEFTETETVLFDNVDVQMRVFNISDVPDPFDPSLGEQTTIQFDIEGGPLQAFADWSIQYYDAYAVETSPPHFGFFVALPSTVTDSWDGLDFSSGQLRPGVYRYLITPIDGGFITTGNPKDGVVRITDAVYSTVPSADGNFAISAQNAIVLGITVTKVADPEDSLAFQLRTLVGDVIQSEFYRVEPSGTPFAPPGIIAFKYDSALYGPKLRIVRYNPTTGDTEILRGWADEATNTLYAEVDGLSYFFLIGVENFDRTPPTTRMAVIGPRHQTGDTLFIAASSRIAIAAADDYTGVATTEFRFARIGEALPSFAAIARGESFVLPAAGAYILEFRSTDRQGNAEKTHRRIIVRDNTPPEVAITPSAPPISIDSTLFVPASTTFTVSVADPSSGIAELTVVRDDVTETTAASSFGPFTFTLDGRHEIAAFATDFVGNLSSPVSLAIVRDSLAPATTLSIAGLSLLQDSLTWVAPSAAFALAAQDPLPDAGLPVSGVKETRVNIRRTDGTRETGFGLFTAPFTLGPEGRNFRDGEIEILYRSEDKVANRETTRSTVVQLDLTAPIVSATVGIPKIDSGAAAFVLPTTEISFIAHDSGVGVGRIEYEVRSGNTTVIPLQSVTGSVTLASLPDGRYSLRYRAIDRLENASFFQTLDLIRDGSAPITSLTPVGPSGRTGETVYITAATQISFVSTDLVGAETTLYSLDGASFASFVAPFSVDGGGNHSLSYYSVDRLGNRESEQHVIVVLDFDPPVITIDTPTPNVWYKDPVRIAFRVVDNVDLNPIVVSTYANGTTIFTEGEKILEITATDIAGNTASDSVTFTVDFSPPIIFINAPAPNSVSSRTSLDVQVTDNLDTAPVVTVDPLQPFADGPVTATVTAIDAAGNVATQSVSYTVDTVPPTVVLAFPPEGYVSMIPVTAQATVGDNRDQNPDLAFYPAQSFAFSSHHTVTVVATDDAGNTASDVRNFIVDLEPPTLTITAPPEGAYRNTDVTVTATAIDFIDPNPTITFDPAQTTTVTGRHRVVVTARDFAGHAESKVVNFVIDKIAPTVEINVPSEGLRTNNDVTLNFTVDDNFLADGVTTNIPNNTIYTTDGARTVEVVATDRAGNTGRDTISFLIDKVAPVISNIFPPEGYVAAGPVDVIFTVTDNHDAAPDVTVTPAIHFDGNGPHSFTITATDFVGNATTVTRNFRIDDEPPAITITSPTDGLLTNQNVMLTFVTSDNLTSVSTNIASGTLYSAEGDYEIVIVATDEGGNSASDTVRFTIDKTAPAISITSPVDNTLTRNDVTFAYTVTDPHGVTIDSSITPPSGTVYTADGVYRLTVVATDDAGNRAEKSVNFTIDKVAPVITLVAPPQGLATTQNVTLTYTMTDNHDALPTGVPVSGTKYTAQGRYNIEIVATDDAGNTSTLPVVFTIDRTRPVVTILEPANFTFTRDTITLRYAATDNLDTDLVTTPANLTVFETENRSDITVTATDDAGNVGTASVTFFIDRTSPTITITSPPADTIIKTANTAFRAQVSDSITPPDLIRKAFFPATPPLVDGLVTLTAIATDVVGNVSAPDVITFTIDNTSPTITIEGISEGEYTPVPVTPVVTVTDLHLATVTPTLNNAPYTLGTEIAADGVYSLKIVAVDTAGNVATSSVAFTVDRTNPTVAINGVTEGQIAQQVTPVIVAADVNFASVISFLDGDTFTSGTQVIAEGPHTLIATARDKAGNTTSTSVTFTIDRTAPEITIEGIAEGQYTPVPVTPIVTVTDLHLATVTPTLNNAPYTLGTEIAADGVYTLKIVAVDTAGNVATASVAFTVDRTNPTVAINGVTEGQIAQQVTPVIVAADANFASVISFLDGDTFTSGTQVIAEGPHTLIATARDKAGNTASTSVTFTIDRIAPAITIEGIAEGQYTPVPVTPIVTVTDLHLAAVTPTLNNAPYTLGTEIAADGVYTLKIVAVDTAGNVATASVAFTVDRTAPEIVISGVTDSQIAFSVIPIVSATDVNFANLVITLDGAPFISGTQIIANGAHTLVAIATDKAGNVTTVTIGFSIDRNAPVTALTISAPKFSVAPTFVAASTRYTLEASDTEIGVDRIEYQVDGAGFQTYSAPFTLLLTQGAHSLSFRSVDNFGNTEASSTVSLISDQSPPASEIEIDITETDSEGLIVRPESLITITSTDRGAPPSGVRAIEFAFDAEDYRPYTAPFVVQDIGLSPGSHIIRYRAVDQVDNLEQAGELAFFLIPSIEITKTRILSPRTLLWWNLGDGGPEPVSPDRRTALERVLKSNSILFDTVTTASAFISRMRNGLYNVYVIDGDKEHLEVSDRDFLAELVNSGAGLIGARFEDVDGPMLEHGFPDTLDQNARDNVFGVKVAGTLPKADAISILQGTLTDTSYQLDVTGRIETIRAVAGDSLATVSNTNGNKTDTYPAVVLRKYGAGHALYLAFDLANFGGETLATAALRAVAPETEPLVAGGAIAVRIRIVNVSERLGATLMIEEIIPTDLDPVAFIGNGSISGQTLVWTLDIGVSSETEIGYVALLPDQFGTVSTEAIVSFLARGRFFELARFPMTISVPDERQILESIRASITALAASLPAQQGDRDRANEAAIIIENILSHPPTTSEQYLVAATSLAAAVEKITRIRATTLDRTEPIRQNLDDVIRRYLIGAGTN